MNKVILIGNLGADAELKAMPNGGHVAKLNLATTKRFKDKDTNEKKEKTEWHRVIFFGKAAETLGDYASKGTKIAIEGELQTRKWQKEGVDHYTTEVIGESFEFLGGGKKDDSTATAPAASAEAASSGFNPFDDDLTL